MSAEFWTVVVNGGANLVIAGAMFIQTVIFTVTFIFGFRYLDQHRQKVKEEQKQRIIIECVVKILKLKALSFQYYAINYTEIFTETDPIKSKILLEKILKNFQGRHSTADLIDDLFYEIKAFVQVLNVKTIEDLLIQIGGCFNDLDKIYSDLINFPDKFNLEFLKALENAGKFSNPENKLDKLLEGMNSLSDELLKLYHFKEV